MHARLQYLESSGGNMNRLRRGTRTVGNDTILQHWNYLLKIKSVRYCNLPSDAGRQIFNNNETDYIG